MNCLPQESIRLLSPHLGEFDISKMFDLSSKERFNLFDKYLSSDEALFVNNQFEKAMISNQNEALNNWVKETFVGRKQKARIKDITEKINDVDRLLGNNEAQFIEGIISERLGITVTAKEFEKIHSISTELEKLAEKESKFGSPTIEYFLKRKEMTDYMNELAPTHNLRVATSTIGRGVMLTSIKSPVTNIAGNTTLAISESLSRRLSGFKGSNKEYALEFWKFNNELYQKTGYDLSRMFALQYDQKILGEDATHSQGPGMVRRVGRFFEDVVFKQLMGAPDVAFASAHFVDSADINSTKIARQDGYKGSQLKEKALEIFKDATRVDPLTNNGQIVRTKAMQDAMRSTFTDDTVFSSFSLKMRQVLNDITGDVRLGDLLVPFVKTPANVIARSIESSGVTLPYSIGKLATGFIKKDAKMMNSALNSMARAGIGLTGAWMIMAMLDPDDYIGEYSFVSQKERELMELKGASYNSIKIGDEWYSMDYFGPFAGPLVGLLNARKYGKGGYDSLFRYVQGVATQLTKIPGIDEVGALFKSDDEIKKEADEIAKDAAIGLIDFVSSRVVPGIVSDLSKVIDEYERDVTYGTIEGALENIERKIPGLSKNLEPKMDIFGNKVKTQKPMAQLFFGARYKQGKENLVINELNRLNASGNLPSLTDIRRSSTRMDDLLKKIGRKKWTEAFVSFGRQWEQEMRSLFKTKDYQLLDDEGKKNEINKIKNRILKDVIYKYSFDKEKK